jgi:hypothetical protein
MFDLAETRFAQSLSMLESLESEYASAPDGPEQNRIKETMKKVIGEIPDEHLTAFRRYAEARVQGAESDVAAVRNILDELETEKDRRRGKT